MVKKNNNSTMVVVIIALFLGFMVMQSKDNNVGSQPTTTTTILGCENFNPQVTFQSSRMFLTGTGVLNEGVRAIEHSGEMNIDLGSSSTNSGTLSLSPPKDYTFYFAENSSTYYTSIEKYTAECKDSNSNINVQLCKMDDNPTITVKDSSDNVNSATNSLTSAASTSYEFTVKVRASADKCYGNPESEKDNVICFEYEPLNYSDVVVDTNPATVPLAIINAAANGNITKCYTMPKIADLSDTGELPLTITTSSLSGARRDIEVRILDIGFDLNSNNLEEIWDFQDEDGNYIGSVTVYNKTIEVA